MYVVTDRGGGIALMIVGMLLELAFDIQALGSDALPVTRSRHLKRHFKFGPSWLGLKTEKFIILCRLLASPCL